MEHEVTIALISMAGGVAIALIAAFSAYMKAAHTARVAADKREIEELARKTVRRAEITALKAEITELKLHINQLEKENARLKRRITCLDKALRESTNKSTDCNE